MGNRWIATGGVVILSGIMVSLAAACRLASIWRQSAPSAALIVVFLWLLRTRRKTLFALIPAVFMMTSTSGRWSSWSSSLEHEQALAGIGVFLLAMALLIIGLTIKTARRLKARPKQGRSQ